jgi:hypothetical protein
MVLISPMSIMIIIVTIIIIATYVRQIRLVLIWASHSPRKKIRHANRDVYRVSLLPPLALIIHSTGIPGPVRVFSVLMYPIRVNLNPRPGSRLGARHGLRSFIGVAVVAVAEFARNPGFARRQGRNSCEFRYRPRKSCRAPVQTLCDVDESGLLADGHRPEVAFDAALGPNILAAAMGPAEAFTRLLNAESRDAGLEDLADLGVADDIEVVAQQAGGHGFISQGACCCNSMKGKPCPHFQGLTYAFTGRAKKNSTPRP